MEKHEKREGKGKIKFDKGREWKKRIQTCCGSPSHASCLVIIRNGSQINVHPIFICHACHMYLLHSMLSCLGPFTHVGGYSIIFINTNKIEKIKGFD